MLSSSSLRISSISFHVIQHILQFLRKDIVTLDLFDHELVAILDLFMAGTYNIVLVPTKHFNCGIKSLHTIMLPLIATAFVTSQCMALLAFYHSFTNCELVSWKKDSWHETSAVSAGNFVKQAHLFMFLSFLFS